MDEVLFHISQHLEALQVYLNSSIQHGRLMLQTSSDHTRAFFTEVWSGQRAANLREGAELLYLWLAERAGEVKRLAEELIQPRRFLRQIQHLLENDRTQTTWLTTLWTPVLGNVFPQTDNLAHNSPDSCVGEFSRTGLYFGGLGFLFGGLFGVMLGLSWYRPPPPTQRMRAVVCMGYYGPDSLATVDDLPVPTISSPDQILVQVKAASVDTVDSKICCGYGRVLRKQLYAHSYVSVDENVTEIVKQACVVCSKNARHNFNFPVILGRDCSGIIIEIGQKVKNFEVGDEVWFGAPFWSSGTMCECVVVKENVVAKKPRGVGFEVAASLPYTGTVAWNAMVRQAGLNAASTAGKRILVHGGSSPVGCILIQLATLWGGSVATTCSSRATPVAQALGAEEVIVTGRGNVEKQLEVRESFDMIFNTVEGSLSHEACLRFCRPGGHVVTTFPSHVASDSYSFLLRPTYNLWLRIKVTAHSSQLTPDLLLGLSPWGDLVPSPATLDQLAALVEDGSLQPVVDKIFSPQDAELAFQHAGSDEAIGKTVIRFR
uniref:Enoyl reductase (ER) domain-containing protein n=1 Tax=Timema shepardi TaxID=629360 RepID=A0A7R9ASS2_TIMSH|nr:unnamed protein product [Timema shepardi]